MRLIELNERIKDRIFIALLYTAVLVNMISSECIEMKKFKCVYGII